MQKEKENLKARSKQIFKFKQFEINQEDCAMKIGTDGVLLGAWADISEAEDILDVGAGTGVIAIMLAQRASNAMVDAVEIDQRACSTTSLNMENSPFADRLNSINESIQDYARGTRKEYDLIVSNPPFFTGGTLSMQSDRNDVRHTVKLPSGDLLNAVRRLMKKNGKFCVILPLIEGLRFKELARNYNLYCTRVTEVQPKHDKSVERLLLQFEKQPKEEIQEKLVIQFEKRNDYTEDYIALTREFYLNM